MSKTHLIVTLVAATATVPALAAAAAPGQIIDSLCSPESVLSILLGPNWAEVCGEFYGRLGYAGVKPCQPPNPNIIGLARTLLQAAYDNLHDKPGCDPTVRELLP